MNKPPNQSLQRIAASRPPLSFSVMNTISQCRMLSNMTELLFDETKDASATLVGYGALLVRDTSAESAVSIAFQELRKDPDALDNSLDSSTQDRGFFHASADSKNAHSHLCTSINKNLNAEFNVDMVSIDKLRDRATARAFERSAFAGSLNLYHRREPIGVVYENRRDLTKARIEAAHHEANRQILLTLYDHPFIPALFPKIVFRIGNKSNPGLQCCDFLLWAVLRKILGQGDWFDRLKPRTIVTGTPETKEWYHYSLTFGDCQTGYSDVGYDLSDMPKDPDSVTNNESLWRMYLVAEDVIRQVARDIADHVSHFRKEIINLDSQRDNPNQDKRVERVSSLFLKLFDTLPIVDASHAQHEKELLLMAKKYLSLSLRCDIMNGVMVNSFLERCRNSVLANQSHLL